MNAELTSVASILAAARFPEDVFGDLDGEQGAMLRAGKRVYRRLARVVHADKYPDPKEKLFAEEAFKTLARLWTQAQERIEKGRYGTKTTQATFTTKRGRYDIYGGPWQGDTSDVYRCTMERNGSAGEGFIKVARHPGMNALLEHEVSVLRHLVADQDGATFHRYLPTLVESFTIQGDDGERRASVFDEPYTLYSFEDVRAAYPGGVDVRTAMWMWRRMLEILGYVRERGVVHGAVLPSHLLIEPENHGLALVGWTHAVHPDSAKEHVATISSKYRDWYPPEVLKKLPATPATDLYLAARSMIYILGGDPVTGTFPSTVPRVLKGFLRSCLIASPHRRPQDAWEFYDELDEALRELYGPPRFHPFTMPKHTA